MVRGTDPGRALRHRARPLSKAGAQPDRRPDNVTQGGGLTGGNNSIWGHQSETEEKNFKRNLLFRICNSILTMRKDS